MSETRIGIILLAAGASVRMGTPKQLISIEGVSLIRRAALAAIGSGFAPVVVVLGAHVHSVRLELEGLEVYVAINPQWSLGMASSIRCGLEKVLALAPDTEGIVLMLADQPGVTSDCLKRLGSEQEASGLVAARYNHVVGPPALFRREYFCELSQLQGQSGARPLIERRCDEVLAVDMPEAARDLDTPADLAEFQCSHGERASHSDTALRRNITREGIHMQPIIHSDGSRERSSVEPENASHGQTRREFVTQVTVAGTGLVAAPSLAQSLYGAERFEGAREASAGSVRPVKLNVNGSDFALQLDPRVTLLDALREHLNLTGSKKGCDHGQCGACTVLVNGRRINSCLALAIMHEEDKITTIEGLAEGDALHPMQASFLEHDGFQCGYCTPGQICSAVALMAEGHTRDDAEIREWMSGNLCRCGAYTNIVAAIRSAIASSGGAR